VLDGGATGGTSYGYFSNYNSVRAEASASANNLCAGDSIQLQARMVQNGIYQWTGPAGFNSNQQNPVIPNAGSSGTGWYYLTVTTGIGSCGSSTDSVYVSVQSLPAADLGPDVAVCMDSLTLRSPTVNNAGYQWSTGATSDTLVVRTSDTYWITVTDNTTGCRNSDTVVVALGAAISVDLGPDTAICEYDLPYTLSSPQPSGTTYLWSNGYSDSTMSVTRSGDYWLQVSRNGCVGSDTIDIEVIARPEVFIGGYQVICASVPEGIGMEVAGASYLWSTGATTSHIQVNETGLYWLEVDVQGCKGSDSAYILAQPDPVVDLGPDGYICTDQEIVLDAGNSGHRYYWSTGSSEQVLHVAAGGLYHVTVVSPDSCVGRDSILLTYLPDPVVLLGVDTTGCVETPLVLHASVYNADDLRWSDGNTGPTMSVQYGGAYTVTAINECGADHDTINVQQIFCDIWLPNVFTPNGDGKNDVFRVLGNLGRIDYFGLSIFDRWGQRVFYTSDKYQGWDGVHNGTPCMMGTFVYMLEYHIEGKPMLEKGNFHLIR
jgi:gliding motility-associated-like protein